MVMKNKLDQSAKSDFASGLKKGEYVDSANENMGLSVSLIVSVSDHIIKIHDEGYTSLYDREIKKEEILQKLAPFRTQTKGFPGMKNSEREDLHILEEDLDQEIVILNQIISTKFECFTNPHYITQLLRGTIFFKTHHLLTCDSSRLKIESSKVILFLEKVILLIGNFFNIYQTLSEEYNQFKKNSKLIIENP